jgi:hypothetical protein
MKFFISTLAMVFIILLNVNFAFASCMINATWTPSPNADKEVLLLDGVEQSCPEVGKCDFLIPEISGQEVVIRSFNTQGGYVDYEAKTLDQENLPSPATGITITIMCTN